MRAHEFLNFAIRVPLLSVYLIATDVEELIGKELGHFADELIEKMVSMLLCWIHGRVEDAPFALNLIRAGSAGQIRIADKPGGAVSRHVEFRDHANAALARIRDHVADLVLRVVEAIRAHFMQLGEFLALNAEALIL